jgi:hypothetical protein
MCWSERLVRTNASISMLFSRVIEVCFYGARMFTTSVDATRPEAAASQTWEKAIYFRPNTAAREKGSWGGGNARTRFQYPPLGNTACFGCNHS